MAGMSKLTAPQPSHNPDTSPERLGDGWVYCRDCGHPIRRDEQDATSCDPNTKREYQRYLRAEARKDVIRERMAERERKFREAQAADERAIYAITYKQTYGIDLR